MQTNCDEAFAAMGIDYGAGHRGIQRLYLGSGQVLAKLDLPDQLRDTDDRFVLHPSLMDAALQAILGLLGSSAATTPASVAEAPRPALPLALRELRISGGCSAAMWAWVRYAATGAEGHQDGAWLGS